MLEAVPTLTEDLTLPIGESDATGIYLMKETHSGSMGLTRRLRDTIHIRPGRNHGGSIVRIRLRED